MFVSLFGFFLLCYFDSINKFCIETELKKNESAKFYFKSYVKFSNKKCNNLKISKYNFFLVN